MVCLMISHQLVTYLLTYSVTYLLNYSIVFGSGQQCCGLKNAGAEVYGVTSCTGRACDDK